jgi:predicted NAD/FAD-binding protein
MRVAVIGTGIAGLTAAWLLRERHRVELFEREPRAGGHTHTVSVRQDGRTLALDTGFLVHNPRNYPHLVRLFERLGVRSQASDMSFSVRCHRCDLEYRATSPATLFAQRRNLFRPGFHRLWIDVLRFHRDARAALAGGGLADQTLVAWAERQRYSRGFVRHFLLPLCGAIWSSPPGDVEEIPAMFALRFLENHGLLALGGAPVWRTLVGGNSTYVRAMTEAFGDGLRLGRPVVSLQRTPDGVRLRDDAGAPRCYDAVVIATHADEALKLLEDPSLDEQRLLGVFHYTPNEVVLHHDESALPRRPAARAAWNYELDDCAARQARVSVTYSLNRLQRIEGPREYLVSLNRSRPIDPARVIDRMRWTHPHFTLATHAAQRELPLLSGRRRTWYCGAYFGYGFHEDAHVSGLAAARQLLALG